MASTLSDKLGDVKKAFDAMPLESRKGIFNQPAFELILNSLGLQSIPNEPVKTTKKKNRTPLSVDEIAKFIGEEEKTIKDISEKFEKGGQTVKLFLDGSKKFTSRKQDPNNQRSKLLYKVKK